MSKDKKRDKEDELYLASLKGMVRIREILRRLKASSVEADLATEALDDMISDAVSAVADRIEKSNKSAEKVLASQRNLIGWGLGIIGTLLTIIAVFVGIQSLGS